MSLGVGFTADVHTERGRPVEWEHLHDTSKEAIRALKRQISSIVYRHLTTDAAQ